MAQARRALQAPVATQAFVFATLPEPLPQARRFQPQAATAHQTPDLGLGGQTLVGDHDALVPVARDESATQAGLACPAPHQTLDNICAPLFDDPLRIFNVIL